MKNLVIRTVFTLTLLLTLAAIFAGVNPAPAHADSPTIHRVDCTPGLAGVAIATDHNENTVCFSGTGTIKDITLYNVSWVCPGPGAPSSRIIWQNDGHNPEPSDFPSFPQGHMLKCFRPDHVDDLDQVGFINHAVNRVIEITINEK